MANSLARDPDNIVRFQPKENTKLERITQLTDELKQNHICFCDLRNYHWCHSCPVYWLPY